MAMMIGYGHNQVEASRETIMRLIEKRKYQHPESTEAEAEEAIRAMSPQERESMLWDRHAKDGGGGHRGPAFEYDPLAYGDSGHQRLNDGLPAPNSVPSGNRGWYGR